MSAYPGVCLHACNTPYSLTHSLTKHPARSPRLLQVALIKQAEKASKEFAEFRRQRDKELVQLRKQGRCVAAALLGAGVHVRAHVQAQAGG